MSAGQPHLYVVEPEESPSGDDLTFVDIDEAFRRYAPYVARIALRILGDASEVEDIVQDVFLIAHKQLKDLREPKAIKGWLATVTVRRVNKVIRWKRVKSFVGLDTLSDRSGVLKDDESSQDNALLVEIYRVLDHLPANVRVAWVLRHVEGENLDRVAELTGCSRATAHRRVVRARAALQEALDDER